MGARLMNKDARVVWDEVIIERDHKVVKLNPDEERARSNTEPWFKPKAGSVFPAKKRSVKRMMFDYLVQSVDHIFRPGRPSSAASQSNKPHGCFKIFSPPKSSNAKQSKIICPNPP